MYVRCSVAGSVVAHLEAWTVTKDKVTKNKVTKDKVTKDKVTHRQKSHNKERFQYCNLDFNEI